MKIPLQEVRLSEAVPALGISDIKYVANIPPGVSISLVGEKVVLERAGYPDVIIFPAILKSAIALENYDWETGNVRSPKQVASIATSQEPVVIGKRFVRAENKAESKPEPKVDTKPKNDTKVKPAKKLSF